MLDNARLDYDSETRDLNYRSGIRGKELLHKDEGFALSQLARAGDWNGQPVARVVVHFGDMAAAKYNADPMKFLGLVSSGPEGEVPSEAKFAARSDFGIDP